MAVEDAETKIQMASGLKIVRRLAADLLKCGKSAIWIDPDLSKATREDVISRQYVKKMISRNFVVKRIPMGQSKLRCRERAKARAAGRHTGPGKRSGTANARSSSKSAWIFRIRVLRRLLKNYRREGKIDKKLYHSLYLKSKGNVFKNKRVLVDHIHKAKSEAARLKAISDQIEALREKSRASRLRRKTRKSKSDETQPKPQAD